MYFKLIIFILINGFSNGALAFTESLVGDCVARCDSVRHEVPLNVELPSYKKFCAQKYRGHVKQVSNRYVCVAPTVFNMGEIGIDSYRCNDMNTVKSWLQMCGELITRDNKCLSQSQVTIENWSCDADTGSTRLIRYGIR